MFLNPLSPPLLSTLKATTASGEALSFYTLADYEQWKRDNNNERDWKIKYYKGLGTSSPQEAKDYFAALDSHKITFRWGGGADGELIDMFFNKKRAAERRTWIEQFEVPHICLDRTTRPRPSGPPADLVGDSRHMPSVQCCA